MSTAEQIQYIINSNPSLFDLRFKDYVNGKITYTEPSKYAIQDATKDLELFQQRQKLLYDKKIIGKGDWVILKDGRKERVTVTEWNDTIQVGGSFGGSYHVNKYGGCSYSGGCGDLINRNELVSTDNFEEGSCWIFSQDWSGAGRGVYNILKFRVWKQI
jgi:hypothetical protein